MTDKTNFVRVIQENEDLIYKISKLYTDRREDEQDLYQEIVYQLWKSFDSFRNESRISTWIYRIALNTAIAYLNKEKRRGRTQPINEMILNRTDDLIRDDRYETLYSQIRKLNTIEKGIILLYLEGKSYEEMALITGFTSTNIGTRLARIKQKMITQIKK
ncbi:MAG TPA: sigma-70 family RNA polymerase sigma factor [Puia sp.]|nr:sigma-70 family RNA polymerase sigma factor [Puia sp.]